MLETKDRFVNNELLRFISRPQYKYSCSMTALTAVINYLYSDDIGIKTTKHWAMDIGIHSPKESMGPENQTVMDWFKKVCKHYKLSGNCGYFIQDKDVKDWDDNPKVITKLKNAINSKDTALIYHLYNHYNIVVGYFENSTDPDLAYEEKSDLNRWIILGEHSKYNKLEDPAIKIDQDKMRKEKYNMLHDRFTEPVWCIRWGSIRRDLINTPNHCILEFRK